MLTIKLSRNIAPLLGVGISLFFIFYMPNAVTVGVTEGLKICFSVILPSLFPFMVLSSYIVKSQALRGLYKFLSPVSKYVFKLPASTIPVIIMGLIGGFPVGAKMTSMLLERGEITKNQAIRLCLFAINGGPAFIITAVGANMLGNIRAGVVIFISICLSYIILGFAISFFGDKEEASSPITAEAQSPMAAFSASVNDGVQGIISICAWVVLFSGFSACISTLPLPEDIHSVLIALLEVTKGCSFVAKEVGLPIITAIIAFGGLCVHCQIYGFIKTVGVKYRIFFAVRVICSALASIICHLILKIFPVYISTAVTDVNIVPFSVSIPSFIALIILCIVMIFDIDSKKKVW